jgi:hypothetical protein
VIPGRGRGEVEYSRNSSFGHCLDRLPCDGERWPAIL